jgi:hypothetical protein
VTQNESVVAPKPWLIRENERLCGSGLYQLLNCVNLLLSVSGQACTPSFELGSDSSWRLRKVVVQNRKSLSPQIGREREPQVGILGLLVDQPSAAPLRRVLGTSAAKLFGVVLPAFSSSSFTAIFFLLLAPNNLFGRAPNGFTLPV